MAFVLAKAPLSVRLVRCVALILLAGLVVAWCRAAYSDHFTDPNLESELRERSGQGLALARILEDGTTLEIRYFDGRMERRGLDCCMLGAAQTISQNRVVAEDLTAVLPPDIGKLIAGDAQERTKFAQYGGPIVVMDMNGIEIGRTRSHVNAVTLALSRDGTQVAFLGNPISPRLVGGVYTVELNNSIVRLIKPIDGPIPYQYRGLDWSPDGKRLLFSNNDEVWLIDVNSTTSTKIAEGALALWSPDGGSITYIDKDSQPVILDLRTGSVRIIDGEHETRSRIPWSPDGQYLFLRESLLSWVYRISDGARVSLSSYGSSGLGPLWVQLDTE